MISKKSFAQVLPINGNIYFSVGMNMYVNVPCDEGINLFVVITNIEKGSIYYNYLVKA